MRILSNTYVYNNFEASGNASASGFTGPVTGDLIGNCSGSAGGLSVNLPVSNLDSGTNASSATYWRGDGIWETPEGGGIPAATVVDAELTGLGITYTYTDQADDFYLSPPSLTIGEWVRTVSGYSYYCDGTTWNPVYSDPRWIDNTYLSVQDLSQPMYDVTGEETEIKFTSTNSYMIGFVNLPDTIVYSRVKIFGSRVKNNHVYIYSTGFTSRASVLEEPKRMFGYYPPPNNGGAFMISRRDFAELYCDKVGSNWRVINGPAFNMTRASDFDQAAGDKDYTMDGGWGNDAENDSSGMARRYTLNEYQYLNLDNKEFIIKADQTGYGSPTIVYTYTTYQDLVDDTNKVAGSWYAVDGELDYYYFWSGYEIINFRTSQYGIPAYVVGDNDEDRLICRKSDDESITYCFVVFPDLVDSFYGRDTRLQTLAKDHRYFIDTSEATRTYLGFTPGADIRGDYKTGSPIAGTDKWYSFNDKRHMTFEFYPLENVAPYTGVTWAPIGDLGILFRSSTGSDGFGNAIVPSSKGHLSRYTLSEAQYIELDSQIGHITYQTVSEYNIISGLSSLDSSIPLMNQTVIVNADMTGDLDGTIGFELNVDFNIGARVRFIVGDNPFLVMMPVGIVLSGATSTSDYSAWNKPGYNTTTDRYYVIMGDNYQFDTIEFQFTDGMWGWQIFDFASYVDGLIPWSKIDTTGILTLPVPTSGDVGKVVTVNATEDGYELGSAEPPLGNPDEDGKVLSSTTTGERSWVAPGTAGAIDWENPISISTATELTINKHHIISDLGSPADYTVTLPAVSGNAGKLVSVEMNVSLTKLVTLDGNASETIDGNLTRVMWAKETAILLCNGTTWTKVAGKTIPFMARMRMSTGSQLINATTETVIDFNDTEYDSLGIVDLTNNRITIKRAGKYLLTGYFLHQVSTAGATRELGYIYINSTVAVMAEQFVGTGGPDGHIQTVTTAVCAVNDIINLRIYSTTGGKYVNPIAGSGIYPNLAVTELPTW